MRPSGLSCFGGSSDKTAPRRAAGFCAGPPARSNAVGIALLLVKAQDPIGNAGLDPFLQIPFPRAAFPCLLGGPADDGRPVPARLAKFLMIILKNDLAVAVFRLDIV